MRRGLWQLCQGLALLSCVTNDPTTENVSMGHDGVPPNGDLPRQRDAGDSVSETAESLAPGLQAAPRDVPSMNNEPMRSNQPTDASPGTTASTSGARARDAGTRGGSSVDAEIALEPPSSTPVAQDEPTKQSQDGGGARGLAREGGVPSELADDLARAPELYAICTANFIPYFPDGSCADGSCAEPGVSAELYAQWKRRLLEVSGLSEQSFEERIEVHDVSIDFQSERTIWRVEYVFVLGWVRIGLSSQVVLEAPDPLTDLPIEPRLDYLIDLGLDRTAQFTTPQVTSIAAVQDAVAACHDDLTIDWCGIGFVNRTGLPVVQAAQRFADYSNVDEDTLCHSATVDLSTAELLSCVSQPCLVSRSLVPAIPLSDLAPGPTLSAAAK